MDNVDTNYHLFKSLLNITHFENYSSFGIRNTSITGFIINPIELRYENNSDNKDIIRLNPSGGIGGNLQFNNLKNEQFINISINDNTSHSNNKLVKIFSVENSNSSLPSIFDVIVLNNNYSLDTYPTTNNTYVSSTITAYYSSDISYSLIKGGTYSIFNSEYYYLNNRSSILEEGQLSINNGIFSSTYYNVITVGNEKSDY